MHTKHKGEDQQWASLCIDGGAFDPTLEFSAGKARERWSEVGSIMKIIYVADCLFHFYAFFLVILGFFFVGCQ
ncbi:hypothetical protein HanPI659440_Chr09g0356081 [Helianthus annuus]|nr:hypothetical protein HanPI659440_Chr09g0356081 [Helianthus annuus]